jgi:YD repeat-containing protein
MQPIGYRGRMGSTLRPYLVTLGILLLAGFAAADAITYTYDAAGRLLKVDYGNGNVMSYTYDPAGNLLNRTVQTVVAVTIQTSPAGLQFTVDSGTAQVAPQTLNLSSGSHTIAVVATQAGAAGTQYVFTGWSDNGAASHPINVGAVATYTASFNTQYQLTTSALPVAGGTVTPSGGAYYDADNLVQIAATANAGYAFSGWSGTVANPASAATTVTMSAPETVTADFSSTSGITIQTNPMALQFSVDGGAAQTAPKTLNLSQGTHTIAVVTTQAGTPAGTEDIFTGWSDGGAASHSITVTSSAATYTASFTTQYLLTTYVSPAGSGSVTASPTAAGYYNAGTSVQLTASANAGYQFSNWIGGLSGSTNPQSITMNAPETVTANFSSGTSSCSFALTPGSASLPATGTSTAETCPNNSGQPSCGVTPETPVTFTVTPSAACGAWTATSSNPGLLQITSGASGSGAGTVGFALLSNTHNGPQNYTLTVASATGSATYSVTEAGSGDSQTYREVHALYEQLLGRDPDPAGFAFWTGQGGAGLGQMADSFLTSPEAFNSDFAVMAAYQAATGAPPMYAQFTAAVASIRAGTQTVGGLFNALIGSGFTAATLYQNLLNRAPAGADSACINTGLGACFQTIIGFQATTTPVGAANNEFQSTGTYHTTVAADHTNGLYVQMIYYVTVSRDPDAGGLAFWTGVANGGGPGLLFQGSAGYLTRIQILGPGTPGQGFIGSPEFQGLFAN